MILVVFKWLRVKCPKPGDFGSNLAGPTRIREFFKNSCTIYTKKILNGWIRLENQRLNVIVTSRHYAGKEPFFIL